MVYILCLLVVSKVIHVCASLFTQGMNSFKTDWMMMIILKWFLKSEAMLEWIEVIPLGSACIFTEILVF
jgi:hypothetical protein